jgi:hypothetical protein
METRYVLRQMFEESLRAVVVQEAPSPAALAEAARRFDSLAREVLRCSGWPPSAKSVAHMLGEHLPDYYAGLQGRKMSTRRLLVWYAKWSLICTSGGRSAVPVSLRAPPALDGVTERTPPTLAEAGSPPATTSAETHAGEVWMRTVDGQVFRGWFYKEGEDGNE